MKQRLDLLLVERGLAESRERAQRYILAGEVRVGDRVASKAGERVDVEAAIEFRPRSSTYVSRGGEKLAGALEDLGLNVEGWVVADVGASTGGFTDCVLQGGAKRVYAIDVGYGQLAWKLREDERVVVLERTNARHLEADALPEKLDLVVVDVSFISLRLVLPAFVAHLAADAKILAMVKPQFEVGRERVGKGGVVRDAELHREAVDGVRAAGRELGWVEIGESASRLVGPKGNREFFLLWSTS